MDSGVPTPCRSVVRSRRLVGLDVLVGEAAASLECARVEVVPDPGRRATRIRSCRAGCLRDATTPVRIGHLVSVGREWHGWGRGRAPPVSHVHGVQLAPDRTLAPLAG
jgi:hypothetical protein